MKKNEFCLPSTGEPEDFLRGSIYYIGTATILLRYAGFTILTDPNFLHAGDHVHLGYGMTSKRLTNPAMEIENLPEIDFCILSHYHGDHFDQIVEQTLRKDLPIITTHHAAGELRQKHFMGTIPLKTWDRTAFYKGKSRVEVTSMPGKHGPGMVNTFLPETMGSMVEFYAPSGENAFRIYISGDTLVFNDLKEIPKRYPDIDLGLFHLGGTRIMGILVTMDHKQGVEAVRIVNPRKAIPIHYNDYPVFKSSLEEFKKAVAIAGIEDRVDYLSHGDTYEFTVPESRIRKAA